MKRIITLALFLLPLMLFAQNKNKIFNRCDPNCSWGYFHPFKDSSYTLAIQVGADEDALSLTGDATKNAIIYFGKDNGNTDKICWKIPVTTQNYGEENLKYEDYNGDGVKDLVFFLGTGGTGANELFFLMLKDEKKHNLTPIKGFEEIANPSYNKKHNVIVGYAYSGANYYSIYKINNKNKIQQIGNAFEDTMNGNQQLLDKKIEKLLEQMP